VGDPAGGIADVVWFLDRSLGRKVVAEALRAAGARVEVHDDHFAKDAPDEEWLLDIGARGWLLVARDERIRYEPAERLALTAAQVGAFFITAGNMTGPDSAALLVTALPRMERLVRQLTRPFIVTISRGGGITVKLGTRRGGVKR
jgi:hypothetical protein